MAWFKTFIGLLHWPIVFLFPGFASMMVFLEKFDWTTIHCETLFQISHGKRTVDFQFWDFFLDDFSPVNKNMFRR
jgi:hypothetical protein